MMRRSASQHPRFLHKVSGMLCLLLLCSLSVQGYAEESVSTEYQLKAALIYKLAKFIEWPDGTHALAAKHFKICILGEDHFGSAIDALEKRKLKDMPIRIQRFNQSEAIDSGCKVLYVSKMKRPFLHSILKNINKLPILTLSDMEGFADEGGIIQFTRGKKRIGFQINQGRARDSGLTIAAPLLDLSTIVDR